MNRVRIDVIGSTVMLDLNGNLSTWTMEEWHTFTHKVRAAEKCAIEFRKNTEPLTLQGVLNVDPDAA